MTSRWQEQVANSVVELKAEDVNQFSKATGWTHLSVPPTYLTCFRETEFELLRRLGIELKEVLHAEQRYDFPEGDGLEVGVVYDVSTRVTQVIEKGSTNRVLVFLTLKSEFRPRTQTSRPPILAITTLALRRSLNG